MKSVKRAITTAIGDHVMTVSELQTVCFEAANLVNERPIGRHPTSPDDGTYLCPNDLLLGRATSRVPSGPFRDALNPRQRVEFVQLFLEEMDQRLLSKFTYTTEVAHSTKESQRGRYSTNSRRQSNQRTVETWDSSEGISRRRRESGKGTSAIQKSKTGRKCHRI